MRYVAEDSEESSEDESETTALSSNSAISRRMGSLKGVYVPQEKGGLPPHWDEVESEDGEVYYWNKLTGETQWERPVRRNSSTVSRIEVLDESTGKYYYWNQQTGSTRWTKD